MTKSIIPIVGLPRWTLLLLVLLGFPCNGCITIACLALTGGRGTGCSAAAHADGQIAGAFVGAVVQGTAAAAEQEDEDEGEVAPSAMPLPPPAALRTNEEPRLPPPPFYTPPLSVPASPSSTELHRLRTAEGHLAAGRYREALEGSYAVATQGTQRTTAWLLVGLSACHTQDVGRAQEALFQLRPKSSERSLVERTCTTAGLRLPAASPGRAPPALPLSWSR